MTVKELKQELNKYPDDFNIVWEGDYECAGLNDFNKEEAKFQTVLHMLTHGQFSRGKNIVEVREYFNKKYEESGTSDWDDIERKFGYDIDKTLIMPPKLN